MKFDNFYVKIKLQMMIDDAKIEIERIYCLDSIDFEAVDKLRRLIDDLKKALVNFS